MGIISDTLEDTTEKILQFIDQVQLHAPRKKKSFELEPLPIFISCPLCAERLMSDKELDRHVLTKHANRRVYLRADSRVLRDFEIFNEAPATLKLVLIGTDKATVTIRRGDGTEKRVEVVREIDLVPHLPRPISGVLSLKVEFSDGSRDYTFIVGKTADFNHEEVDKHALKSLFLPLHQRETPEWSDFSSLFFVPGKNPVERQYAAGLYDYALGFHVPRTQAKEHLETALGILSSFNTNFAVTACRVLATRMNCFKLLQSCKPTSRFYAVNLFFNEPAARYGYKIEKPFEAWSAQEYGVFIDEFTEIYLGALNAYYAGHYSALSEMVVRLDLLISDHDKNSRDKLILLQARAAKRKNDKDSMSRYYEVIRHHPDFGEEAREML